VVSVSVSVSLSLSLSRLFLTYVLFLCVKPVPNGTVCESEVKWSCHGLCVCVRVCVREREGEINASEKTVRDRVRGRRRD